MMRFSEIAGRITGFSTPTSFGLQCKPPQVDVDVAREVIVFLEDRRVLYSPYEAEVPEEVLWFRLRDSPLPYGASAPRRHGAGVDRPLRAMRIACRKLIETT